jgi:uncharacterized protein (DUF486 family)
MVALVCVELRALAPLRDITPQHRCPHVEFVASLPWIGPAMNPIVSTILLLVGSNFFMTYAWYGHLKNLGSKPLVIAILASWGVAFFEYVLQVPANRIGFGKLTLPQLKMLQEVITLSVFVPFSVLYMKQSIRIDFLWAALCMCGAVYFMFRGVTTAG